ncbi:MAG TPA: DUF2155 domain-containing protein [Micropepsaceae bacterium]|nr:DUF2155 domain-containing protein [Micropepsaceae bacterium]
MIRHAALALFLTAALVGGVQAASIFGGRKPALAPVAPAQPAQPAPPPTLSEAHADAHGVKRLAILRALDKISGRTTDIDAPAGVPVRYGPLIITAEYCYTVPPEQPPETTAFVQIDEADPGQPVKRLFSGWMFASSPALNALEHPTYDVWVINCKTDEPAKPPGEAAGALGATAPTPAPGSAGKQ